MLKAFLKNNPPSNLANDITNGRFIKNDKKGFFNQIIFLINEFLTSCQQTDLFGVCAQMAFTLIFALLPTLLFIILVCNQFVPNFERMFYSLIQILLPSASVNYITSEISNLFSYVSRMRVLIFILSALMGTLSAHTFLIGINQTYGFDIYHSKRWEWFKSFIILLVFVASLALITLIFIYLCQIAEESLINKIPLVDIHIFDTVTFDIFLVVGIFIILLGFYIFTPQRRIYFQEAIPGSIFSTLAILIVFRIYVAILNHSSNYILVYGSFSGLFLLLTAFYFICVILNFGAKINVFFSFQKSFIKYDKIN